MPPAAILEQLASMSSVLAPVAAAWHVAIIAIAAAIVAGWRPTQLVFATLLLAPLVLSVASLALAFGNAFNGASFALLALGMLVLGGRLSDERAVTRGPLWTTLLGGALILFGACYPHFVAGPWYLVPAAAPVGIVPCPTLAVLAGATLIANGGGSRAIPAMLAAWCAFYAGFGIVRLGVTIDVGLVVAAIGLVAVDVRRTSHALAPSR